jgi:hypothetical protein
MVKAPNKTAAKETVAEIASGSPPIANVVEIIPSVQGGISAIASADAPFLYFEAAPFYGLLNGVGQVTLDTGRIFGADASGKVIMDRVLVAHLRGNLNAIRSLRAALDGILLMAEPRPSSPSN